MKELPSPRSAPTMHRLVESNPPVRSGALSGEEKALVSAWRDRKLLIAVIGLAASIFGACTAVIAMRKPAVDAAEAIVALGSKLDKLQGTIEQIQKEQGELKAQFGEKSLKFDTRTDALEKDSLEHEMRLITLERARRARD